MKQLYGIEFAGDHHCSESSSLGPSLPLELASHVIHLALKLPNAVVPFDQLVFMGLDQPRLLHIEVLGGPLPLLPQQLLHFVGLVGLKAGDLVLQLVVLSLQRFELLVEEDDYIELTRVLLLHPLVF